MIFLFYNLELKEDCKIRKEIFGGEIHNQEQIEFEIDDEESKPSVSV